jgi:hypothetical protein
MLGIFKKETKTLIICNLIPITILKCQVKKVFKMEKKRGEIAEGSTQGSGGVGRGL